MKSNPNTVRPVLIKSSEVCKMLSICRETLRQLTDSGELPHMRLGGHLRFPLSQIEAWIEEKVKQDTEDRTQRCQ